MNENTIGVAGIGLLGRGIAACLLAHGMRVLAWTPHAEEFLTARASIAEAIEQLIQFAGFPAELRETWPQRYSETTVLEPFTQCVFVIESVVEDEDVKRSLFAKLEEIVAPHVPIASNTSAIPITLLQQHCRHPERILGMHWAEPAHATRFLELICGEQTGDSSLKAAMLLAETIGKQPCVVQKDVPGFIANRIGYAMYREACNLLATGVADAATIDRSFRNSVGLWASVCGPFQWIDLTGGPVLYAKAMSGVLSSLESSVEVPEPLLTMSGHGCAGVRNGEGFYRYTAEEAHSAQERYRQQAWRVRAIGANCEPPG